VGVSLTVGLMIAAGLAGSLVAAQSVTAAVSPVRDTFIFGEPIELTLTLRNTSRTKVNFTSSPPHMCAFADSGLAISSTPGTGGEPPRVPRSPWDFELRDPVASLVFPGGMSRGGGSLGPGQASSTAMFLQDFVGDLQPGVYWITYSVDCPTLAGRPLGISPTVNGSGEFMLVVSPGIGGQLTQAFARWLDRRVKTDRYCTAMTATYALLLADSPVAVPYLIQMDKAVACGGVYNQVVMAMEKFKGNRDATNFVLRKLRTGDQTEVVPALYVLGKWRYDLPRSEVTRLLNSSDMWTRLAGIRYIYQLPRRTYLPLLRSQTSDPNGTIAEAARRVIAAVNQEQ